jgi:hypothetical protein
MAESLSDPMACIWTRYIAIDLHKHYLMIGGIDGSQRVVLPPRKLDLERWLAWAQANLLSTDAVVIEATTNAWHIYDQLLPLVGRVVVAHPPKVKQIAAARVKTDCPLGEARCPDLGAAPPCRSYSRSHPEGTRCRHCTCAICAP